MRYLSICSGIEAATVAWHSLGWRAVAVSEIEPFACALLKHHYPSTQNLGDMTKFHEWPNLGTVDVLVGGTPCQSFSVAGLRKGLADPRGNLTLAFLGVVERTQPAWVVWENVPGIRSDKGNAFGQFIAGLAELGYHASWRSLDAQYFGLAQRRERVFVVASAGDWRRSAAVLFEPESLSWNPAPSRETREDVGPTLASRACGGGGLGTDAECDEGLIAAGTSPGIGASGRGFSRAGESRGQDPVIAMALNAKGGSLRMDGESETFVTHALKADGFDASEDWTGRGTPIVPIGFSHKKSCMSTTLDMSTTPAVMLGDGRPGRSTLRASPRTQLYSAQAVRRLTPRECERLQGFPDDYTLIPYRGKPAKDGPRYRALGNSMAVPVMRWIGERIEIIEQLVPHGTTSTTHEKHPTNPA